ncbi:amidoligase family protein [Thermopirellula anaerolimosa]
MNATELTFGIEIETIAPDSAVQNDGLRIGPYRHGIQVPYLPAGWKAEADGSIDNGHGGHKCEIVSPVLRGEEGIRQVIEVLEILEAKGHRVNASCGVHIHVGWRRDWPSEALARLVTIVAYLEKGLYAITGTKSRERGRYCGGVRKYGSDKTAKPALDRDRYHALNLTNLARGTKDTVEFRVFSGSLNPTKVVGWIQVSLGLVERALAAKRMPTWAPKAPMGGWKKSGPGQSETERLLGYLAWGRGYARIHGGKQYGWISDAIPQDEVKAEFRRLARKYDAMP